MLTALIWLAGLGAAFATAAGLLFNRLVRLRNLMQEAWSGVEVQLRRRHDLIPNLVRVVEAYAKHERAVLEAVTLARSEGMQAASQGEIEHAEKNLTARLVPLLGLIEAYPTLKADQTFLQLQNDLVAVENELQMARRYFNGTVRDFNTAVESFPSNVVAGVFRFEPGRFFEIESATERLTPNVRFETGQS